MVFEFTDSNKLTLMEAFADFVGCKIQDGLIEIPRAMGSGYVKGIKLGASGKLMLHHFNLKEDLVFRRKATKDARHNITFTFHTGQPAQQTQALNGYPEMVRSGRLPSVKITSANIDYETLIPAKTNINTIIIVMHFDNLCELLSLNEDHSLLQKILSDKRPYFYEEVLSAKMQEVANDMFCATIPADLNILFYKIKVQELIYLFFVELLKRDGLKNYPINAADIKIAYLVRDQVISDLSVIPNLADLATMVNISESKLKRLFKQIFGQSIYNYFQIRRMQKAADLISKQKLSVSEAGYHLGFSNLSHFSRLFQRYIGMKPKKYSLLT